MLNPPINPTLPSITRIFRWFLKCRRVFRNGIFKGKKIRTSPPALEIAPKNFFLRILNVPAASKIARTSTPSAAFCARSETISRPSSSSRMIKYSIWIWCFAERIASRIAENFSSPSVNTETELLSERIASSAFSKRAAVFSNPSASRAAP